MLFLTLFKRFPILSVMVTPPKVRRNLPNEDMDNGTNMTDVLTLSYYIKKTLVSRQFTLLKLKTKQFGKVKRQSGAEKC